MSNVTVTPLKDRATWAQQRTEHDPKDAEPRPPVEPSTRPNVRYVKFVISLHTCEELDTLKAICAELERGMKLLDADAEVDVHVR